MNWTLSAFADESGDSSEEQVRALTEAGLRHVDLRSVDGFNITTLPLDQAREIKARLDAAGIAVNMFGSPIGKLDIADDFEIDLAKLRHLGELAPIFDCLAVRIFSYYNKAGAPLDRWHDESLGRLGKLRDLAARLGLVLYHENELHIFGDPVENVLTIARELRQPTPGSAGAFRLIFDFDNFNQGGADVWSAWVTLRDHVDAFHLKDSDAAHQHVPAGAGATRMRDILTDAAARGWQGSLSLEPHLSHSGAVAATGPGGKANAKLADLTPPQCFQIAAAAGTKLLRDVLKSNPTTAARA